MKPTADDLGGYVSSDVGGTVRRCGCFICGIDLRWRSRKTSKKHERRLSDEPVHTETKSGIVLPSPDAEPRELMMPRFSVRSGTEAARNRRHLVKTVATAHNRGAGSHAGLDPVPLRRHCGHGGRQHQTVFGRVGQPESETVSLSHYYRRHQHRARNHNRAMRQVAEWIENAGIVDSGVAKDTGVARRQKHSRRHVHEHRHYHHHHHYHYSVSGVV